MRLEKESPTMGKLQERGDKGNKKTRRMDKNRKSKKRWQQNVA